jgi:hypothetical protein
MTEPNQAERGTIFPAGLLDWAGNRGGGVRRLFDPHSGRPGKAVFETNLLQKLRDWTRCVANLKPETPRVVLLVGGPGNGKTEAVEATAEALDEALNCGGTLIAALKTAYHPASGIVDRMVRVDAGSLANPSRQLELRMVADASVGGKGGDTPASLLVAELAAAVHSRDGAYICCVNRGVLDDAMILAIDDGQVETLELLEEITRAVSSAPDAPKCWPLAKFPHVAIWPMDAESLLEKAISGDEPPPAQQVLRRAVDQTLWADNGTCAAGASCPFCTSRKLLDSTREGASLLRILRWFELGTSKRWAFRDLFSLFSYLLAGSSAGHGSLSGDPCGWAARLLEADKDAIAGRRPRKESALALYQLVAAQYQHALFHRWERRVATSVLRDIRELGLHENNPTAMGLHYFLQSRSGGYVPQMIATLLDGVVDLLDPAHASPDAEIDGWGGALKLAELDIRFSRSVREGLELAVRRRLLTTNERALLERLVDLDEHLALPTVRSKKPTAAARLQRVVRDFACRLVRRSVGTRQAVVPSADSLDKFQRVVADSDGHGHELREIANQVEDLLNDEQNFHVSLTTTFGQPLPPLRRRAILVVPRRRVAPRYMTSVGRPRPSICFLDVEVGEGEQAIALTYDLFNAVTELDAGLSPASLPSSVLALLDTTRAQMAGWIVRDRNVRERPTIHVGEGTLVERHRGRFVLSRRTPRK